MNQVGLAIEGGGMRGCVSAGMVAAVSTLGLMDTFDAVYGSSAGSLVGAYAIAGQVCSTSRESRVVSRLARAVGRVVQTPRHAGAPRFPVEHHRWCFCLTIW